MCASNILWDVQTALDNLTTAVAAYQVCELVLGFGRRPVGALTGLETLP